MKIDQELIDATIEAARLSDAKRARLGWTADDLAMATATLLRNLRATKRNAQGVEVPDFRARRMAAKVLADYAGTLSIYFKP